MINRPDHAKWINGLPRHDPSMSRERSVKDRERQKQLAREMRESQAASAVPIQDRETQPVVFDVVRRSPNTKVINNDVERVLGKYDTFTKVGGNRMNMVGVDQQPPTPAPARQPIHDPDNYPSPPPQPSGPGPGSTSGSSKSQRSLPPPPPQSAHNGTTRPPKSLPSTIKPPHPPSHHAHPKNGEVKGNLKSGPGPGPGEGGGRGTSGSAIHKPSLPHLKVGGLDGMPVDTAIQQIMSEMSIKKPVSAIIKTPHHDSNFQFPITPIKDPMPAKESSNLSRSRRDPVELPHKMGNTVELSRQRQAKQPDGSNIDDDLGLSEDSEEDEERDRPVTDVRLSAVTHGGIHAGQVQSAVILSSNAKPPLSPISPKTSEESSTSDESSDDSDVSSNNTSDEEHPDSPSASPKPQEDKSPNTWKLRNFIPQRKPSSPISHGTAAPGPISGQQPEDVRSMPVPLTALPTKGKQRYTNKAAAPSSSSHRESRSATELRVQSKPENNGHYSDSSGEGESHHRPTPRATALSQISKSKAGLSRMRVSNGPQLSSDSEDEPESFSSWKVGSTQSLNGSNISGKGVSKIPEKPAKSIVPPISCETGRRNSKKNPDLKKDNQVGAKSESVKSKRTSKSQIQTDSDDSIIDVVTTTPEKVQSRGTPTSQRTPSRTPKDFPKVIPSPVKSVQASPHASPRTSVCVSSKNSAKRSSSARLSESQSSESLVSKSDDEIQPHTGHSQSSSQKLDQARDKGGKVNRTFNTLSKKDKMGRDKDPSDSRKTKNCDTRKGSGGNKDSIERSKTDRSRTVSEPSPADSRNEGRPGASPIVSNKLCESPIVSAEPKVPIPQIQYENGVARLTCTIPLSFIDKVPKHSENSASSISKTDIKQEVDTKDILDNRTREGKGKRKTCDPNTKASCNEDKSKSIILTSIFKYKTEQEKVKKETKTEPVNSDEEDSEKVDIKLSHKIKEEPDDTPLVRPGSVRQRNVSASPMSSIASDSSTSRQHQKKKKKDKQPEKSPPSRDRKRAHSNSERIPSEHGSVPPTDNSSSDARRSRRDTSVESERSTITRKREHERDSSLESTKSSSRSTSESTEKRSKKARLSKGTNDAADVPMNSPDVRSANQQMVDNSQNVWPQEEDIQQSKYTQRSKHSQHSSQDYKSLPEDSGRNQATEFGEEEESVTNASQANQLAFSGKEKGEANGATASTESGYQPRPTSEHESNVNSALYRSANDQTGTTQAGAMDSSTSVAHLESSASMVPPVTHRLSGATTVVGSGAVHPSLATGRPAVDQHGNYANPHERHYGSYPERFPEVNRDYTCYLNKAKELKHIADGEADRSMQAMKYLEAALYFILSGRAMENDHDTSAPLTMYKDTLHFIKWVSSVFRRENQEGTINLKLAVISLRCQSLLSLKIYKMRRNEHKENQRQLNRYFQTAARAGGVDGHGNNGNGNGTNWGGQRATGSPSHLSQTPSPAGSVGSEGSQSSGYTTSTEGTRQRSGSAPVGHTPPHPQPPHGPIQTVPVPVSIHALIIKQNQLSGHLASAHDMWIEADHYVYMHNMEDFFSDLDRQAGQLTLHSSLYELVCYVMFGLDRLRG
ncbi:AF4/FMR2 family member 4-like isoform X2 [Penaeus indicus]|uniref:AF4/FMR2 family member 4-like isoform X2 n=1 Tax=Penaeus indicus TaxID=29960 RepID=UPI00300CB10D